MLGVSVPIAHELLEQYVKQGRALVQRASLVGDFSDYESWKAARKQWVEPTVQALEHVYGGSSEAEEFKHAVSPDEDGQRWQQQYATDLHCVKAASDLLVGLQGDLAFAQGGESWQGAYERLALSRPDEQPAGGRADPDSEADLVRDPPVGAQPEPQQPSGSPQPAEQPAFRPRAVEERATAERAHEHLNDGRPAKEPVVGSGLAPAASVGAELAQHSTNGAVSSTPATSIGSAPARTRQVFVAHGRNETWKQSVAQLLEHAGTHEVTVLNEPNNDQRMLVEQFVEQVPGSHYAVVLLTADDVGAPRMPSDEEPYFSPRARQGVVFEMGFLVAALTPGCVCVLYEDGVELPCEVSGIAYVRLDFAGTWQSKLLLQLRRAGFDYDLNKLAPV
jgi:predicted nucleotide-binding protein